MKLRIVAALGRKAGSRNGHRCYSLKDYPTKEDVTAAYNEFVRENNEGKDTYDGLWPEELKFYPNTFRTDEEAEDFGLDHAKKWETAAVCQSQESGWVISAWVPE